MDLSGAARLRGGAQSDADPSCGCSDTSQRTAALRAEAGVPSRPASDFGLLLLRLFVHTPRETPASLPRLTTQTTCSAADEPDAVVAGRGFHPSLAHPHHAVQEVGFGSGLLGHADGCLYHPRALGETDWRYFRSFRNCSNLAPSVAPQGLIGASPDPEISDRCYENLKMVGAAGFEPATPCAQGRCATRLRHAPTRLS